MTRCALPLTTRRDGSTPRRASPSTSSRSVWGSTTTPLPMTGVMCPGRGCRSGTELEGRRPFCRRRRSVCPGVVTALVPDDEVHLAGEEVGEPPFAFVAPLGPDHHGCCRHERVPPFRCYGITAHSTPTGRRTPVWPERLPRRRWPWACGRAPEPPPRPRVGSQDWRLPPPSLTTLLKSGIAHQKGRWGVATATTPTPIPARRAAWPPEPAPRWTARSASWFWCPPPAWLGSRSAPVGRSSRGGRRCMVPGPRHCCCGEPTGNGVAHRIDQTRRNPPMLVHRPTTVGRRPRHLTSHRIGPPTVRQVADRRRSRPTIRPSWR